MLKIRLLKSFEASLNEEALPGLGPQIRRLLIYLTLHADRWVEKETIRRDLKTVCWSKNGRSVAPLTKGTLRQQIHRLGEALGSEGVRIESGNGTVRLNLEDADVDILRFNSRSLQGSQSDLEQAIQLYQGELLGQDQGRTNYWQEEWEAWVAPERAELHSKYLTIKEKLKQGRSPVVRPLLQHLEFPSGGVPLDSPFYIKRQQDTELGTALLKPGQTLLIKGPRQVGKTSLMTRLLDQAEQSGARIIRSDWQHLAQSDLETPEGFFFALADEFAYQLHLETPPEETFHSRRAPSTNFDRYVRSQVLTGSETTCVWGIDEADRLFSSTFRNDIFGKLRAWHNERSTATSLLRRLTIVIAYSTEAHYFIDDPNMSPFNVGEKFVLGDFTETQTSELNCRYGNPLISSEDIKCLHQITGGHPYLVRLCLHSLCQNTLSLADIEAQAQDHDGIFTEHLARIRFVLSSDEQLTSGVRNFVRQGIVPTERDFVRLCAAGLMIGDNREAMRPRCNLYKQFLERYLA